MLRQSKLRALDVSSDVDLRGLSDEPLVQSAGFLPYLLITGVELAPVESLISRSALPIAIRQLGRDIVATSARTGPGLHKESIIFLLGALCLLHRAKFRFAATIGVLPSLANRLRSSAKGHAFDLFACIAGDKCALLTNDEVQMTASATVFITHLGFEKALRNGSVDLQVLSTILQEEQANAFASLQRAR